MMLCLRMSRLNMLRHLYPSPWLILNGHTIIPIPRNPVSPINAIRHQNDGLDHE